MPKIDVSNVDIGRIRNSLSLRLDVEKFLVKIYAIQCRLSSEYEEQYNEFLYREELCLTVIEALDDVLVDGNFRDVIILSSFVVEVLIEYIEKALIKNEKIEDEEIKKLTAEQIKDNLELTKFKDALCASLVDNNDK